MKATVTSCTEQQGKFGTMEKVCDVAIDGEPGTTRVYAKEKTKDGKPIGYYNDIRAGVRVTLTAKSQGAGYFFQKVLDEEVPSNGQSPANVNPRPQGRNPEQVRQAQGDYIKKKAGQYFYAYSCIKEFFDNEDNGILVTEETLRAGAATIIISLDREGPK